MESTFFQKRDLREIAIVAPVHQIRTYYVFKTGQSYNCRTRHDVSLSYILSFFVNRAV